MKKRISKLDDLVHAARNEAPVVSFEETARQLKALAEKRRKPLWMWLADAWAFPLRKLRGVQMPDRTWFAQPLTFVQEIIANGIVAKIIPTNGSAIRGFAGVCAVALIISTFPSLIQDSYFAGFAGRYSSGTVQKHRSSNDVPLTTDKTKNGRGLQATMRINSSSAEGQSSLQTPPQSVAAALASDFSRGSEAMLQQGLSSQAPENSPTTAVRQEEPSVNGIVPPPSKTPSVLYRTPESASARGSSTMASAAQTERVPQMSEEPTFWQRVSLEARMAARTDLASPLPASILPATEKQAQTPLQNIAMGMYFALTEHHTVGIEGGNEPFLTAVRFTSFATIADTDRGNVNTSLLPGLTTPTVKRDEYRQGSTNRTWFGAAYQYNADMWDVLGGVQPLARLTLGGGEMGAVGRTLVGARFMAKEHFSLMLAGEGAAVASQLQGAWNLTPRLGVTLGLSVKF